MPPPARTDIVTDTAAAVVIDPFTIKAVSSRRARAGKLNGGVAAKANSDSFKSTGVSDSKPRNKARRWDHILSNESKSRQPSSLKGSAKYLSLPGLVSLCGGLPSSEYFPIDELALKVPNVPHFSERDTRTTGKFLRAGKHDVAEGKGLYDLEIALNYGLGAGSPQMLRFVTEHVELVHRPPYQDWHCSLTIGNSSALEIAFRLLTEPGQCILMEEFTFSSAVETARPMGLHVVGIKMDGEGLLPAHMDEVLSGWDERARGGVKKPHLLYTVPCGQNPTGATAGAERRRQVYAVARRHDVYILEDDPYYFLQMQPYRSDDDNGGVGISIESSNVSPSREDFLRGLLPSYLRLDTDGRVMRMDSFSKVLSPGMRTGFITASEQIVERLVRHQEVSVQNPSGLAQLTLYKLLDEHWGHGGYLDWLVYLRGEYAGRRDAMLRACEKHLPWGLVEWRAPAAGMFLWLKVQWQKHPRYQHHRRHRSHHHHHDAGHASRSGSDRLANGGITGHGTPVSFNAADEYYRIEEAVFQTAISKGVLVCKGSWFLANSLDSSSFVDAGVTSAPPLNTANGSNERINGSRLSKEYSQPTTTSTAATDGINPFGRMNGSSQATVTEWQGMSFDQVSRDNPHIPNGVPKPNGTAQNTIPVLPAIEGDIPSVEMFFRTTFAAAAPDEMEAGVRRLAEVLRTEFHL